MALALTLGGCGGDEPSSVAGAGGGAFGGRDGGAGGGAAGAGTGGGAGSDASAGFGGSAAAGSGGGAAAGSGGIAGDDAGAPSCTTGKETFHFVVSESEQFKRIALPLETGVEYRRVELTFGYTPTDWSPTCVNPAAGGTTKSGFPAFESLVALKRGAHWCKGGDLFELTLHGPAPGHGAGNKVQAETYYKHQIHTGSGCGTTDVESTLFVGAHGVSAGASYVANVVYDAPSATLSVDLGPTQHQGTIPVSAKLIANPGETWYVVLSFDGGFLECYDSQGQENPAAPCCWLPSIGWAFDDLTWKICR